MVLRASRPASRLTAVFDVVGGCEARDGGGLWVCIDKLSVLSVSFKGGSHGGGAEEEAPPLPLLSTATNTTTEHIHCTACRAQPLHTCCTTTKHGH
ncbi:hypothetical protein ACFX13_028003 [Malus domestica]